MTKIVTRVTLQQSDNVFKVNWEKHGIWLINFFLCCDSINKGKHSAADAERKGDLFSLFFCRALSPTHRTARYKEAALNTTDMKCVMFILKLQVQPAIDHLIMLSSIYKHS